MEKNNSKKDLVEVLTKIINLPNSIVEKIGISNGHVIKPCTSCEEKGYNVEPIERPLEEKVILKAESSSFDDYSLDDIIKINKRIDSNLNSSSNKEINNHVYNDDDLNEILKGICESNPQELEQKTVLKIKEANDKKERELISKQLGKGQKVKRIPDSSPTIDQIVSIFDKELAEKLKVKRNKPVITPKNGILEKEPSGSTKVKYFAEPKKVSEDKLIVKKSLHRTELLRNKLNDLLYSKSKIDSEIKLVELILDKELSSLRKEDVDEFFELEEKLKPSDFEGLFQDG